MVIRNLLVRGMIVGALAGLLVFAFARFFGEPPVERAIAFEAAADAAKATAEGAVAEAEAEPELVSRAVQAGAGLFTGVMVYSVAIGGLFALVFAAVQGRVAAAGPRGTAALLALAGFVAVYLVPSLKYPANPPAVGAADTIGPRTALFFTMLAISVAGMVAAAAARKGFVRRFGAWNGALLAAGLFAAVAIVAASVLPAVDEVPADFPADVLWHFRLSSLEMQVLLWTTLGLGFGPLAERALARSPYRAQALRSA